MKVVTDGRSETTLTGAAGAELVDCKPAPCPKARDVGRDLVIALPESGEYVLTLGRGGGRGERGSGEGGSGEGGGDAGGRDDDAADAGAPALRSAGAADKGSALAITGTDIVALVVLGLLLALTGIAMTRLRDERAKRGEPA